MGNNTRSKDATCVYIHVEKYVFGATLGRSLLSKSSDEVILRFGSHRLFFSFSSIPVEVFLFLLAQGFGQISNSEPEKRTVFYTPPASRRRCLCLGVVWDVWD